VAKNKAKRSIPLAQPVRRRIQSKNPLATPSRRLFRFREAQGKIVEEVEFSTTSDYHCISVNFDDRTSLSFEIETGFTLEADYSDWKTGNQRILREWKKIASSV